MQAFIFNKNHPSLRLALFGMCLVILGMGLGRFLYTPLLAVMKMEGTYSFAELSWLASSNYSGYLAGTLLFSMQFFCASPRLNLVLWLACFALVLLLAAMAFFESFQILLVIRFLTGMASAVTTILGTLLVLHRTNSILVTGLFFSGIGIGIIAGNEYINLGVQAHLSSNTLWLGGALGSAIFLIFLTLLWPTTNTIPEPAAKRSVDGQCAISWWKLALLYGLSGFGYIITATYLPLMTQGQSDLSWLSAHLWSLVGLAIIPGSFLWIWLANWYGRLPSLTLNLAVQGLCVLLTLFVNSPTTMVVASLGFGMTFMGTSALVIGIAKHVPAPKHVNLLGLIILTYGVGQILGPFLTGLLPAKSSLVISISLAASALFIASLMSWSSTRQLKQQS